MPNWVNNQLVINYFDDNEELLEILKQSTNEGHWTYSKRSKKFSFTK